MEPVFSLIVERAIDGDMDALAQLVAAPWPDVASSVARHSFVVTPRPVADVLRRLQRGEITGTEAQGWASFVRRGYMASDTLRRPITPLTIDYEPAHEDAIVEVVARLDEIGDLIDGGVPTDEETAGLLALLAP